MTRLITAITALGIAFTVQAKGLNNDDVLVVSYADFLAIEALDGKSDIEVRVSGPDGYQNQSRRSGGDTMYLETRSTEGEALADGLYKYEIIPLPKVSYTREESMAMPDRNDLKRKTTPGASRVSGAFRVLNGEIVDPEMPEHARRPLGGTEVQK